MGLVEREYLSPPRTGSTSTAWLRLSMSQGLADHFILFSLHAVPNVHVIDLSLSRPGSNKLRSSKTANVSFIAAIEG